MSKTSSAATIVWFRRDLRLADQPAFAAAAARGPVIPVFIWAPGEEGRWQPGAASRWWLHHSLTALSADLERLGHHLVIRRGPSLATLRELLRETGATAVFWNRIYEPEAIARDQHIKRVLRDELHFEASSWNAALLHEPHEVLTKEGKPYQVFTPYHRACQALGEPSPPKPVPAAAAFKGPVPSLPLADLGLLPSIPWDAGMRAAWTPGEAGAQQLLAAFRREAAVRYGRDRDRPDHAGTSRLSPHLHFGEISPRQIWHACRERGGDVDPYLRQLTWREFAHQLLYHFRDTTDFPLRREFGDFPWARNPDGLCAWQKGRTGYPIVDAGMRELWATGWMHNRVRMIVASFLVKDLLIPWQDGARWFWDTLVDADLANNSLGWQWTAGCGADAAPYFRIFNPASQAAKFDPDGAYIRKWVPEIAHWPAEWLHDSSLARAAQGYPRPIVDHATARDRALSAYRDLRARAAG